jgi:hypothetical protein
VKIHFLFFPVGTGTIHEPHEQGFSCSCYFVDRFFEANERAQSLAGRYVAHRQNSAVGTLNRLGLPYAQCSSRGIWFFSAPPPRPLRLCSEVVGFKYIHRRDEEDAEVAQRISD